MRRPRKITHGEMRSDNPSPVPSLLRLRRLQVCALGGDRRRRWSDDLRLSDREPRFTSRACGHRGADIGPQLEQARMGMGGQQRKTIAANVRYSRPELAALTFSHSSSGYSLIHICKSPGQEPGFCAAAALFTMPMSQDIFELVPVGEENAVSGLLLWKQLRMWSPPSIKHKLNEMAANGLIERKRILRGPHEMNLYFRSRA
jgi:hypothetical protein